MISLEKKLIFIHVNKTAGKSVEKALDKYRDNVNIEDFSEHVRSSVVGNKPLRMLFQSHLTSNEYKFYLDKMEYKDFEMVAVVRNPWDRMVSRYFYTWCHGDTTGFRLWLKNGNFKKDASGNEDFARMYKPCKHWLVDDDNNIIVKHILRFENLNEDFSSFCKKVGLPNIDLPFLNFSNRNKNYMDYYDAKTKEIIAKYFLEDIEEFNYRF